MRFDASILLLVALGISNVSADCLHEEWMVYEGDRIIINGANQYYSFQTDHVSIDADGAPNAYHPENIGLDYLANAGYPDKTWWPSVIAKDPDSPEEGYIQIDGEYAGYFVSKTSLQDKTKIETDPERYVDATSIPYLVFPRTFYKLRGTGLLGDHGIALNKSTGKSSVFVVADIGPSGKPMGEISIKLAENLGGINVNPRNGAGVAAGDTRYIVFPYSSKEYPWPLSLEEIELNVSTLISLASDIESLDECF